LTFKSTNVKMNWFFTYKSIMRLVLMPFIFGQGRIPYPRSLTSCSSCFLGSRLFPLNSGTIMPDHMGNGKKKINLFLIFFLLFYAWQVWGFYGKMIQRVFVQN
jgi:hypothetical protein